MNIWPYESDYDFRDRYMLINTKERTAAGLTPELLADVFCEMNSESMAIFLNRLADVEKEWQKRGGGGWPFQLQYVTDEEILEDPARDLMRLFGEYSTKGEPE